MAEWAAHQRFAAAVAWVVAVSAVVVWVAEASVEEAVAVVDMVGAEGTDN